MDNLFPVAAYDTAFNKYLPAALSQKTIYQSVGLSRHIEKRHPECMKYITSIPEIIHDPDYIGVNPNESGTSFELVKIIDENVQIGIKLDSSKDYLYVATLHTITSAKLQRGLDSGRLKPFDKSE